MSIVCKNATATISREKTNHITLAVQPMGNWLTRAFPYHFRTIEVHGGHYGLFYKMDEGKAPNDDNIE